MQDKHSQEHDINLRRREDVFRNMHQNTPSVFIYILDYLLITSYILTYIICFCLYTQMYVHM